MRTSVMRRIKVVPLEATGIYLVDACGVPIVKAQRASTGVREESLGRALELGLDALPPKCAEVAKRLITHRHLHPELKGPAGDGCRGRSLGRILSAMSDAVARLNARRQD